MLVPLNELITEAVAKKRAVAAFDVYNAESALAVVEEVTEEKESAILMVYDPDIDHLGAVNIARVLEAIARPSASKFSFALDHGASIEMVKKCAEAGFPGLMFDGSKLPLAENIRESLEARRIANQAGAALESELGRLPNADVIHQANPADFMTDPAEAEEFVAKVKPDLLAISVGTGHGMYKTRPKIDFERIAELKKRLNVPLVLHGGSGTPEEDVRKAIRLGIRKVNVGTELDIAFWTTIADYIKTKGGSTDVTPGLHEAVEAQKAVIRRKLAMMKG